MKEENEAFKPAEEFLLSDSPNSRLQNHHQQQQQQQNSSDSNDKQQINHIIESTLQNSNTIEVSKKSQWTKCLAFAGYGSTLGSAVPGGYCIGVMNNPAQFMRIWCNETIIERYNLELSADALDMVWSSIVSIFLIGGAVGSLSGSIIANKFGRKTAYMMCAMLFIIGAICFYTCRMLHSIEVLLVGRLLVGLAAGLTTASLPMYHSELAPLELRGTLAVFCAVGLTAGVVVGQVFSLTTLLGSEEQWHVALSFYVIFVLICIIPYKYYPESPKWLHVIKDDRNKAQTVLMSLRGNGQHAQILAELQAMAVEAQTSALAFGYKRVLCDKKFMLPLIIVCVFQGGQQLSGINAIFYYSVSIFQRAGLSVKAAEYANLAAGVVNLVTSLLTAGLMGRYRRRSMMLFSTFFCALSLLSFAMLLKFIDYVSWFAFGCMSCIYLYIFFFQFGIGPIPFFIGSELFEVSARSAAMSLGSLSSWFSNFIVGMAFSSLQNAWGAFVFLPCSLTCVVMFLLTKFYLPETKGRNPSEIAVQVANGFHSVVHKH